MQVISLFFYLQSQRPRCKVINSHSVSPPRQTLTITHQMDGPRLAGSLTAAAIGSFLLGCLFAWAVYKRHRNLDQDIEATKISQRISQISTFRLLEVPPTDNDVYEAVRGLRLGLTNLAWHCADKSKLSTQSISESRLQNCLTELSGGQHRLSPQSLLELLPSQAMLFVSHVVGTTLIGAITDLTNSRTSILHSVLVPEVTARLSSEDFDDGRCLNPSLVVFASHCSAQTRTEDALSRWPATACAPYTLQSRTKKAPIT